MTYYVYENWLHDKAVIHDADCSRCNDGKGMSLKRKYDAKHGHWIGPFTNKHKAGIAAHKTKRKYLLQCSFCMK